VRQAALFVEVACIPIEEPTKFELVINMKTAAGRASLLAGLLARHRPPRFDLRERVCDVLLTINSLTVDDDVDTEKTLTCTAPRCGSTTSSGGAKV
jgi:hypothetical protein